MDIIAERLRTAMKLRNMRQVDIITKTGINKGSLSSYLSGKYEPKQNNIYLLAQALNVNEAWLMGHDVQMEKQNQHEPETCLVRENPEYGTKEEHQIIDYFNSLNRMGKQEAIKRIYELTCIPMYQGE